MTKTDDLPVIGERLRALRDALGLTSSEVCERSEAAAARLGSGYDPISLNNYSNAECGQSGLAKHAPRAVLCEVFSLSLDDFKDYLDRRIDLDELLARRAARLAAPPARRPRQPAIFREAPNWAELVQAAKAQDPDLTDETFREMGDSLLPNGPVASLDANLVAQMARALQTWRRRSGAR